MDGTVVSKPAASSLVLRSTLLALAAASVGPLTLAASPALAQAPAPAPAPAPPQAPPTRAATQEELALYTTMGAVASCDLAVRSQVPLTKSLPSTTSMVAYILSTRHGSEIQGVSTGKLSNEQLMQGSFIQIVGGIRRGCYDKLPATDKKEVDTIVAQVEKAAAAERTNKK